MISVDTIYTISFPTNTEDLLRCRHGENWPGVYILTNDDSAYIGEASSTYDRLLTHKRNPAKNDLDRKCVVFLCEKFNKSATLDIEQRLIRLFSADQKYKLRNLNSGQSPLHDYYQKEMFDDIIRSLWRRLKIEGMVNNDIETITESAIYKFTPYTALTSDQNRILNRILTSAVTVLNNSSDDPYDMSKKGSFIVNGCAGTGKTLMAIKLIGFIAEANSRFTIGQTGREEGELNLDDLPSSIYGYIKRHGKPLSVALVVPMTSLRETLDKVFKSLGLEGYVIKPSDVTKKNYDILIVDETHRLCKRSKIQNYSLFDTTCTTLFEQTNNPIFQITKRKNGANLCDATQLDWIVSKSRFSVLFYDSEQTIKGADVADNQFRKILRLDDEGTLRNNPTAGGYGQFVVFEEHLTSQMRCRGGQTYVNYVADILNNEAVKKEVINYQFKLFENFEMMFQTIKKLDEHFKPEGEDSGLCRVVAGYSWKWNTKGLSEERIRKEHVTDITIEGHEYIWNRSRNKWVLKNTVNEIGCVHSVQGFDLNYVGVVFGKEIDYDHDEKKLIFNRNEFYDTYAKGSIADQESFERYVKNAYKVLMTRGIHGCYVYAVNKGMSDYLRRFVNTVVDKQGNECALPDSD